MKKGFTILELLVVISVLVILIGIAIPRFKGMQDAGKIAQAKAELTTMQTAVESYYLNSGTTPKAYPATSTNIATTVLALTTNVPQILGAALYDPFGTTATTEYVYTYTSPYYIIYSKGAGGGTASVASTGVITNSTSLCVSNAPNGTTAGTSC